MKLRNGKIIGIHVNFIALRTRSIQYCSFRNEGNMTEQKLPSVSNPSVKYDHWHILRNLMSNIQTKMEAICFTINYDHWREPSNLVSNIKTRMQAICSTQNAKNLFEFIILIFIFHPNGLNGITLLYDDMLNLYRIISPSIQDYLIFLHEIISYQKLNELK